MSLFNLIQYYKTHAFNDTISSDQFFQIFGPGQVVEIIDKPFERYSEYISLLKILSAIDHKKYLRMHKGTPFYFLAWLCMDICNFDEALFFLDASMCEDEKNHRQGLINLPGGKFLILESQLQVAKRSIDVIRSLLEQEIDHFQNTDRNNVLNINNFIDDFAMPIAQSADRSILTSFYVFLLSIHNQIEKLEIMGFAGASQGLILTKLFQGGLIFESLLKSRYKRANGSNYTTIGEIRNDNHFRIDFPIEIDTSAKTLTEIMDNAENYSLSGSFNTIIKIRNITGHNLQWDNVFNSHEPLIKISRGIFHAIFYFIQKAIARP